MVWVILGGICVALGVFGCAQHVYYVAKNVWTMRHAFRKPVRVLPTPGVVTLNGIVSGQDGRDYPVKVTLEENGEGEWRHPYWEQTSRSVEAYPFELLLPEVGVKVIVEPGADVLLRASATTTDSEITDAEEKSNPGWRDETYKFHRYRTGVLEAGDRAIVTGVLSEKRETEVIATEYRSQERRTRIEYVLRPLPDETMLIDSETLLDEFEECLGNQGTLFAVETICITFFYVQMLRDPSLAYLYTIGWVVFSIMLFASLWILTQHDHDPWFSRPTNSPKPYRFRDLGKRE
jgi:hypothetical protein